MDPENREIQWFTLLREEGYRLTGTRFIIIGILVNTDKALDAAEIHKIAHKKYPSIGLVSVYRTLSILEDLNLIQRVHQHKKCQAYLPAFTGHEHLILCNRCGKVEYFSGDELAELAIQVENDSEFHIQGHWLQFFGLCKDCRQQAYQDSETD